MGVRPAVIILNQDFTAQAGPNRVHVRKSAQDEITWTCPQGSAKISFNDSPFEDDFFIVPYGGSVSSGPVTRGVPGRVYKYTIVGSIRGEKRDFVADPEVEVDN